MPTTTRPRSKAKRRKASAPGARSTGRGHCGRLGWWGDGKAPLDLWAGVTIDIPATWRARRVRRGPDGERLTLSPGWVSPDGQYYFDADEADRACEFFPDMLRHHIGEFAGLPFTLLEYQRKLMTRPIFGWKHVTTGRRRFRRLFAFLPKGSGKSPWGAGTGLYLTVADREAAAEVYAVAADKSQARVVHDNARIMVEESVDLDDACEVLRDSIYFPPLRSTYKVISADASTKHGFRPHGVIFDEFHAQPNRKLYEALKKSMVKRRQPLMIIITHAGDDTEGICFEEYEYAKGVLSGRIEDDTSLPVIFEASEKDDWTAPATWRRVNPGHGITVQHEGVAQECTEAQAEPRKLNDFLRFHLNRWVNQATAWIPIDWWDACDTPLPPVAELARYPCANGTDMAQKIDLAANVTAFQLPLAAASGDAVDVVSVDDEGEVLTRTVRMDYCIALVPTFWLPEDTLHERVKQDRVPYDLWRDQGLLEAVDGAIVTSEPIIRHLVGRDGKSGELARFPRLKQAEFGYDPAFATEVAVRLRDDHHLKVVEVPQNYTHLSEACQVFEALVKAGRIIHGGHRLLRWNLENVAIKRDDAGRIRPVKPRRVKRIDGVVAAIIAISRLMVLQPARKPSPYATRTAKIVTAEGIQEIG